MRFQNDTAQLLSVPAPLGRPQRHALLPLQASVVAAAPPTTVLKAANGWRAPDAAMSAAQHPRHPQLLQTASSAAQTRKRMLVRIFVYCRPSLSTASFAILRELRVSRTSGKSPRRMQTSSKLTRRRSRLSTWLLALLRLCSIEYRLWDLARRLLPERTRW